MTHIAAFEPPPSTGKRRPKWVMLHSGGADSTVLLHHMISRGLAVRCLFVHHGQTGAGHELDSVIKTTKNLTEMTRGRIPVTVWSAPMQSLTLKGTIENRSDWGEEEDEIEVDDRQLQLPTADNPLGVTVSPDYVPGRNGMLVSAGAALADSINAVGVAAAIVCDQPVTFPDTRPSYYEALAWSFENQELHVDIWTPFIYASKQQVVYYGSTLDVPWDMTMTCYRPDEVGRPCFECHSCHGREAAWAELDKKDPLVGFWEKNTLSAE